MSKILTQVDSDVVNAISKATEKRVVDEIKNIMININSDSVDFNKLYNIIRKKYKSEGEE